MVKYYLREWYQGEMYEFEFDNLKSALKSWGDDGNYWRELVRDSNGVVYLYDTRIFNRSEDTSITKYKSKDDWIAQSHKVEY